MSEKKNIRFSDIKDLDKEVHDDFVSRKRTTGQEILTIFIMVVLILSGVTIIVLSDSIYGSIACLTVGTTSLIGSLKFEKLRKHLYAAEFLNAMFASVVCTGYKFSLIAKPDGSIVYIDRAFQLFFPDYIEQPARNLQALLDLYPTPEGDKEKINASVAELDTVTYSISIASGLDKTPTPVTLSIEAIKRPKGYVMLRGKVA